MKIKNKFFCVIINLIFSFAIILVTSPLAILSESSEAEAKVSNSTEPKIIEQKAETSTVTVKKTVTIPVPAMIILDKNPVESIPIVNLPLYDALTTEQRLKADLPCMLPPIQHYYGQKTVYLTFDDGPDAENTPRVLNILRRANIKATFFVVGTEIQANPNILKQIFFEGHAIGNHSYNHVYQDLYSSPDNYIAQLYKNDKIIHEIIGYRPRISRAPGGTVGSFTADYWQQLKTNGYVNTGWNIVSGDVYSSDPDILVANIEEQIDNQALWSHAIVLMHDGTGHSATVTALERIIQLFKDRNFEFRVINIHTPPAW